MTDERTAFAREFCERLRNARLNAEMTQSELARRVGVSAQCVSGYEAGTRLPDLRKASMIADALDVWLDDLVPKVDLVPVVPGNQTTIFDVIGE